MTVALSGGHLTPAVAVAEAWQQRYPDSQIVWFGRRYSQDAVKQESQEPAIAKAHAWQFVNLQAPRLASSTTIFKWRWWRQLAQSVWQARKVLRQTRPQVVVSFGGYVAIPMVIAAKLQRIPIITHEQTLKPGQATQWIARLADRVAVTYPETARLFAADKVVVTGNPLRRVLFTKQAKPKWLATTSSAPILLITGGNQGSQAINQVVASILPELLEEWLVVHQAGNPLQDQNALTELTELKKSLPTKVAHRYWVLPWIDDQDYGWLLQHATGLLGRAGANTTAEVVALAVPSVLIPLPHSRLGEQQAQAERLAKVGGARIIPQDELSGQRVIEELAYLKQHARTMKTKLSGLPQITDADQRLVRLMVQTIADKS